MLIGRNAETAAVDRLLAGARDGRSGVLVLRGEAGVGKSALLEYGLERADGMTVLRGLGIESESELAYAALHQVLRHQLDGLEQLPSPQAAALRAAFGLSTETVDDRFLISLAVLGLLADAAESRPVLCLVDDAQWLDQASADALIFAARRVEAESIAFVFAVREDPARPFPTPGLAELTVDPLSRDESRELVRARLGSDASPTVLEWLVESANGNPLALLELPTSLSTAQLAGREPVGRTVPPATSVEEAYLERVARLPAATRELLIVAACEPAGDRSTIAHAATALGLKASDLAAAEEDGLIHVDAGQVAFHHPLVRSAVYRDASFTERERAHRAIAAVLVDEHDADRRAWHRAAATVGSDDEVAAELEASAGRARSRAGRAAAAAALERAAELSSDPAEAGRRFVLAALDAGPGGRPRRAAELADRADPLVVDPSLRADLAMVRGMAEVLVGRQDVGADILTSGAEAAAAFPAKALNIVAVAANAAMLSGDLSRVERALAVASGIEPDPSDERQLMLKALLDGGAYVLRGDVAGGAAQLEEGLTRAARSADPGDVVLAAIAAVNLGDDRRGREYYARAETRSRAAGAFATLVMSLSGQAALSLLDRRIADAASQAEEVLRLGRELGMENPGLRAEAVLAWAAAFHGRDEECRAMAERVLAVSAARSLALPAATAAWALAELDLGSGRWEEALAQLTQLAEVRPGFGNNLVAIRSTADLVEAAVRAGRPEAAAAPLAGFEKWVAQTHAPWSLPLLARCRGLLEANVDIAAEHFEEALRLHGAGGGPFDRARTELVYGELLRRERRRVEARRQLRAALGAFEQLGAALWAERASVELRATGERARRRDPSTLAQLTPQELQIARLVGEGQSNKDVAAQLFLSPRTVEYHLRKIFSKLGISSRAELIRHELRDERDVVPA
jgi:DNA-binding CsgD family transcriptional regulator